MKKSEKTLGLIALVAVLTGCGGGGSSNTTVVPEPIPTFKGTTTKGLEAKGSALINEGTVLLTATSGRVAFDISQGGTGVNGSTGLISIILPPTTLLDEKSIMLNDGTGMLASGSGSRGINEGKIDIDNGSPLNPDININFKEFKSGGVVAFDGGYVENKGSIKIRGGLSVGVVANGERSLGVNSGVIDSIGEDSLGMLAIDGSVINEKTGVINADYGISGIRSNSNDPSLTRGIKITNKGVINSQHGGIYSTNSDILNEGTINVSGWLDDQFGTSRSGKGIDTMDSYVTNKGLIRVKDISGNQSRYDYYDVGRGIEADTSTVINSGEIIVESTKSIADWSLGISQHPIGIKGTESNIVNEASGKISAKVGIAISAGSFASQGTARNHGIISSTATGMYSEGNAIVVNEENGLIEITGGAGSTGLNNLFIGMKAKHDYHVTGTFAVNKGTIKSDGIGMLAEKVGYASSILSTAINESTGVIEITSSTGVGMKAVGQGAVVQNNGKIIISNTNRGLVAENGGTILGGTGSVQSNSALNLETDAMSKIVLGSNSEGKYGTFTAKEGIKVSGNIEVGGDITKGGYDDSYTLDNVMTGSSIDLSDVKNLTSGSLLYDATLEKDESGNVDAKLVRNDSNLSDFSSDSNKSLASAFENLMNKEEFAKLTKDGKELINSLDLSSVGNLNKSATTLAPKEFLTSLDRASEIGVAFDTTELSKDSIMAIVEDGKTHSEEKEYHYDNTRFGFIGNNTVANNMSLKYGYLNSTSEFENDNKEKSNSLHLGATYQLPTKDFHSSVTLSGEVSMNEMKRNNLDSDYLSTRVGVSGEISKKYSGVVDLEPTVGLRVSTLYRSKAEEKNGVAATTVDSSTGMSLIPSLELKASKSFGNMSIYLNTGIEQELGNLDKDISYSFNALPVNIKYTDEKINDLRIKGEIGLNYKMNDLTLGIYRRMTGEKRGMGAKVSYKF